MNDPKPMPSDAPATVAASAFLREARQPRTRDEVDPSSVSGRFPMARALSDGSHREGGTFWRDVLSIHNNVAPLVALRVLGFGVYAFLVSLIHSYRGWEPAEVTVVEFTGVFLAMMLVLRSNSGYDRWWEARRLWAGLVNQGRNLVMSALSFGPRDARWREQLCRWTAAYAHVCRDSIRSLPTSRRVIELIGPEAAARMDAAPHRPSYVAHVLAEMIGDAMRSGYINTAIFRQLELQRTLLVDYMGGCERILGTRFPRIHRTMLGQFMILYLLAFPFAIVSHGLWSECILTMAVAFSLFSLDQVARELGNPFSLNNRSHLPLDEIARGLDEQLMGMLHEPAEMDVIKLPKASKEQTAPPPPPTTM